MPMSPPLQVLILSKHSLAVGRRAGSGSMQSSISWHNSCTCKNQRRQMHVIEPSQPPCLDCPAEPGTVCKLLIDAFQLM